MIMVMSLGIGATISHDPIQIGGHASIDTRIVLSSTAIPVGHDANLIPSVGAGVRHDEWATRISLARVLWIVLVRGTHLHGVDIGIASAAL